MTEEAISRITSLVPNLTDDHEMLRVQIDELIHLLPFCKEHLPEKFITLVKDADKNTPTTTPGQRLFRNRLSASLEMGRKFPALHTPDESANSPELTPEFHLATKEKSRVFELCTDMRKIIFASEIFDEPHKVRLLNRIAAIEKEVHKKVGKLDTVLAGVVDVGDALGKFGRKIEPLTKRMKEVAEIARGGSKQYEQIPAPEETLGLPAPEED